MADNKIKAPINNGADINEDAVWEGLFDGGNFVMNDTHIAVGFIKGCPVSILSVFGSNKMDVRCAYFADHNNVHKALLEYANTNHESNVECVVRGNRVFYTLEFFYKSEK